MAYTIKAAEHVKNLEAQGDRPRLAVWKLTLTDSDGKEITGQTLRKTDNPPPSSGQVEAEISASEFGPKIKLLAPGAGGKPGGGKGWQPRLEDDPAVYAGKQAAIAAQTSIERALDFMDRRGDLSTEKGSPTDDLNLIARWLTIATRLEEHIAGAARAAAERVRGAKGG